MKRLIVALVVAIVMVMGTVGAGCASNPETDKAILDYSALLTDLRGIAESVEESMQISQPFFSVRGKIVQVEGEDVQIFEYETREAMDAEAKYVSPDGTTFVMKDHISYVDWIAPPHFYKSGRIIVIYIGSNEKIIGMLENVVGAQFAPSTSTM